MQTVPVFSDFYVFTPPFRWNPCAAIAPLKKAEMSESGNQCWVGCNLKP